MTRHRSVSGPVSIGSAIALGLAAVLSLGSAACDRTHMSPRFGQSLRQALATQVIDPAAAERARPVPGLDREEAAVVVETYRRSLSPTRESAPARQSPVLVLPVAPAQGAPGPSGAEGGGR